MTLPPIGHNGGPPLDEPAIVKKPDEPWYDLRLLRMNGKPRNPVDRLTSRTALWNFSGDEKPFLGRRIRGRKDIANSLNGGPLRHQKVTPWRPVPMKPRPVEGLGPVANVNATQRLPYMEEAKAGRITDEQAEAIGKGVAVRSSTPPAIAARLNGVLQQARAGAEMKELAPDHLDIAVKRLAEAGRIVLRCAVDAAMARSEGKVYALASAASADLLAMVKKARGGARSGAGRKTKQANDNYLIEQRKVA